VRMSLRIHRCQRENHRPKAPAIDGIAKHGEPGKTHAINDNWRGTLRANSLESASRVGG
jgi:hypothetical protein